MAGGTRAADKNARLIQLSDLNPFITCGMCKGYLIDATTITECLHSFCKSCIVRHGQYLLNCPTCNVQIHPTLPLLHCKLDSQKQDIVYKLLPNIYKAEQKRRKLFWKDYQNKTGEKPVQEPMLGKSPRKKKRALIKPDPLASVALEYVGASEGLENYDFEPILKNFIRVSAKATIENVQNFIHKSMNLDTAFEVNIFCDASIVDRSSTLHYIREQFYDGEDCIMLLQYGIIDPRDYSDDDEDDGDGDMDYQWEYEEDIDLSPTSLVEEV